MDPYQLIRRLFRSLVCVVPDAAILVLYVLDLIASGLLWWWFITWTDTDVATDSSTLALLTSAAFVAAMALFVAAILVWYIDRAADRGQVVRERTIRTRHDHSRRLAARARPARPGHAMGAVPRPSSCRPRRGGGPRSGACRASGAGAPGQALEVQTADHGAARGRSGAACCSDQPAGRARTGTITATRADHGRPGSGSHSRPAAGHRRGRLSGAAELAHTRRRTDAAGRAIRDVGHQTSVGGAARHVDGDSGDDWPSDEALAAPGRPRTITEQLAARLGAELAAGGVGDFAATARELSEHYPSTAHSDPPDGFEAVDASGEIAARPTTSRFVVMELLRYLALLLLLTGAVACGWLFLGVVDIDPDAPDTVEPVEPAAVSRPTPWRPATC